jgi:hypothetical protein
MNNVVELTSEDMPRWDAFVKKHPYGWICHLSAWKDVLEKSFPHIKGHVIAVCDDATHTIVAGLPMYTVTSWLTGKRLVSTPFATLFDPLITTSEDMQALFPGIIDLYNRENANHVEIRATFAKHLISTARCSVSTAYKHHYLLLNRPPEELKKTFHLTAVQQPIAQAGRSALTVRTASCEADVFHFYRLFFKTRRRLGLPPMPYTFFKTLWDVFGGSGHLTLLIALYGNTPVAAVILFKFGRTVCLEFAADDVRYRQFKPNHFLYWESIKSAYAEGFNIFSLGRTAPVNSGLMNFKQRWGTRVDDLMECYYPQSASDRSKARKDSWQYAVVRHVSTAAPDFLFKIIGNFCYRHMG